MSSERMQLLQYPLVPVSDRCHHEACLPELMRRAAHKATRLYPTAMAQPAPSSCNTLWEAIYWCCYTLLFIRIGNQRWLQQDYIMKVFTGVDAYTRFTAWFFSRRKGQSLALIHAMDICNWIFQHNDPAKLEMGTKRVEAIAVTTIVELPTFNIQLKGLGSGLRLQLIEESPVLLVLSSLAHRP